MALLIDDLRIIELKKLFAKTQSHQLHEFVTVFRETAETAVDTIENAGKNTPLDEILREAHRLKGASLNIGAPALADLAAWIEKKAKAGDRQALDSNQDKLKALHAATLSQLAVVLRQLL
jgi:HPt (histidine-containing phosphotransfer) domain-containing protein